MNSIPLNSAIKIVYTSWSPENQEMSLNSFDDPISNLNF